MRTRRVDGSSLLSPHRAWWSHCLALRDSRALAVRAAPSVKAAAPHGEAAFVCALAFAGCGEGDD